MDAWSEWCNRWATTIVDKENSAWAVGELFTEGKRIYRESNPKATDRDVFDNTPRLGAFRVEFRTIREYSEVAEAFPPSLRNGQLSFKHHREIWSAGVSEPAQMRKWLELAEKKELSCAELREALSGKERSASIKAPIGFMHCNWCANGVAGYRELFPVGKPINEALLESIKNERAELDEEERRIGLR